MWLSYDFGALSLKCKRERGKKAHIILLKVKSVLPSEWFQSLKIEWKLYFSNQCNDTYWLGIENGYKILDNKFPFQAKIQLQCYNKC